MDTDWHTGPGSVWRDRAVFHFMTTPQQRERYRESMARAVRLNGHAIIGTFAEDGPTTCSGLPITRYSAEQLTAAFAPQFECVSSERELHTTPAGGTQAFTVCHLRRSAVP